MRNDFEGNKNIFWKVIKRVRKGEARNEMVNNVNGLIFRDGVELRTWVEYFEQVLNVENVREANINIVGVWHSVGRIE